MRYLFRPPATDGAGLLALPWHLPLEEWDSDLLLEIPQRGISRHVVRFVAEQGQVFALKEMPEPLARHEYTLLGQFEDQGLPTVSVLGICVDRPGGLDAILVTRYLEYSMSYRYLFSLPTGEHSAEQLLDTLVVLLVRLHLAGVFWGDCSLSNALFRLDAGTLTAYLVDAETAEHHPTLSDGQRDYDIDLARERVAGELLDLQFGELLPADIDPIELANSLPPRYAALWDEVTREVVFAQDEQRYLVAERLQRLNDLGFDVGEVELITLPDGRAKLRVETRVSEPGYNRRELFRLTGLEVSERQARRLLNDLRAFRAYLEQKSGDLPAGDRRHPAGSGRPAGTGGGLPRGARAPLVPVRAGRPRHRHDSGRPRLLRHRAAPHTRGDHYPVGACDAALNRDGRWRGILSRRSQSWPATGWPARALSSCVPAPPLLAVAPGAALPPAASAGYRRSLRESRGSVHAGQPRRWPVRREAVGSGDDQCVFGARSGAGRPILGGRAAPRTRAPGTGLRFHHRLRRRLMARSLVCRARTSAVPCRR